MSQPLFPLSHLLFTMADSVRQPISGSIETVLVYRTLDAALQHAANQLGMDTPQIRAAAHFLSVYVTHSLDSTIREMDQEADRVSLAGLVRLAAEQAHCDMVCLVNAGRERPD